MLQRKYLGCILCTFYHSSHVQKHVFMYFLFLYHHAQGLPSFCLSRKVEHLTQQLKLSGWHPAFIISGCRMQTLQIQWRDLVWHLNPVLSILHLNYMFQILYIKLHCLGYFIPFLRSWECILFIVQSECDFIMHLIYVRLLLLITWCERQMHIVKKHFCINIETVTNFLLTVSIFRCFYSRRSL